MPKKKERRVEVGWVDYMSDTKDYKQVYQKTGGGIKHEKYSLETPLSDILEQAKAWFFPKGNNIHGNISEYDFFITDPSYLELDGDTTVEEMYENTRVKMLRLYVASKRKLPPEDVESSDELPEVEIQLTGTSLDDSVRVPVTKKNKKRGYKTAKLHEVSNPKEKQMKKKTEKHDDGEVAGIPLLYVDSESEQSELPLAEQLPSTSCLEMCPQVLDDVSTTHSPLQPSITSAEPCIEVVGDSTTTTTTTNADLQALGASVASNEGGAYTVMLIDHSESVQTTPGETILIDTDTPTIQFRRQPLYSQSEWNSTPPDPTPSTSVRSDTVESPRSPTPPPETTSSHDVLSIHRSQVQQEMISIFMNPVILVSPIKYRLVNELGADALGVSREVYSAFWQDFFQKSSVGEDERVPALFPDYGRDEWEAIGRILLKGYVDTNIYPIQLSYAFSCAAIYGEDKVSGDILVDSLRMYLLDTDRHVVDKALLGQELDPDDQDDFLDLLGRVNCHTIPSQDEIRSMVISIAHKELIQEPKYALDAIACVAGPGLQARIPSPSALQEMYNSKTPTPRKIIKLLDSSPANQEQASALAYLKQFIKGLDSRMLRKFMRHVTGSEFISTNSIEVTFNRMRGFERAPQAHTCGPLLELPCTYGSYRELRNEFWNILDANYMNIDIV